MSNCLSQSKIANGIDGTEKDIIAEAERLDIKDKAALVLAEILFTDNMVQEIKKYRKLLLRVSTYVSIKSCYSYFC